jgi:hypothetical protein
MRLINYPGDEERKTEAVSDPASLSKRAALRVFQRAFVLAGRERNVRQHIREAHCLILWVIEDWDLAWTVVLDRGKIEFDRRPTKHPDLTLTFPTADEFFNQVESSARKDDGPARTGDTTYWKYALVVYSGFCASLREVLQNPVDENGIRLA